MTRTARRDTRFFEALEQTGSPAAAARVAGYPRSTVYHRRASDEAFRVRWDEALALYVEDLERALDARGFEGTEEPVIYQGKVQYRRDENGDLKLDDNGDPVPLTVRKFDTRAAMFRLQGLRPDSYGGRTSGRPGAADDDDGEDERHICDVFDFAAIRDALDDLPPDSLAQDAPTLDNRPMDGTGAAAAALDKDGDHKYD